MISNLVAAAGDEHVEGRDESNDVCGLTMIRKTEIDFWWSGATRSRAAETGRFLQEEEMVKYKVQMNVRSYTIVSTRLLLAAAVVAWRTPASLSPDGFRVFSTLFPSDSASERNTLRLPLPHPLVMFSQPVSRSVPGPQALPRHCDWWCCNQVIKRSIAINQI